MDMNAWITTSTHTCSCNRHKSLHFVSRLCIQFAVSSPLLISSWKMDNKHATMFVSSSFVASPFCLEAHNTFIALLLLFIVTFLASWHRPLLPVWSGVSEAFPLTEKCMQLNCIKVVTPTDARASRWLRCRNMLLMKLLSHYGCVLVWRRMHKCTCVFVCICSFDWNTRSSTWLCRGWSSCSIAISLCGWFRKRKNHMVSFILRSPSLEDKKVT